ncbi:carbohydrate kinase [Escherichia coli]|uniref:glycine-rich domain-containing protein n=2 Tax=Escherichia coli TaxID=562 RepID=UPI00128F759E|nr:carbohydrate kinase [Escherichia coli]MQJ80476.1 carbohydrate kinase [Escherichia coli]HCJ9822238.1 carbohydrate kinase [Escherichia coli]
MHRIDTKTAQKDKFGAGKNGFTRGNPQTGTPATDLDDDYFDMLQEELCSVVEASGASLEKGRHDQLLTALRALLLSRKNPFGDIKADGTVQTALENLGLGDESGYVGRLLNIQVFTSSGTYTPTAGTTRIKVKAVGGGGAGGGAVPTSTGVSAGGGGGSGAYAEGYYTSGFSGLTVTIGAGGASASGAVGGNGGTTSFGALISCPGGGGGQIGTASNTTIVYSSQGAPGGTPTGSGLIVSGKGQPGQNGAAIGTAGIGIAGIGSPSPFGGGGTQAVNGNNGAPAASYGSGGGGTCNAPSQPAHSGGVGAPGVVIIEEYA